MQRHLPETNHQCLQRISNNPLFHGFFSAVFFLEALLWDAPMISKLDFKIMGAVLYQSLVTATFGFVTWNTLLQKYGAVALHSFIFIMPIAGVALGGLAAGRADYIQAVDCPGINCSGHSGCAFETPQRSAGISDSERDLSSPQNSKVSGVRCQVR